MKQKKHWKLIGSLSFFFILSNAFSQADSAEIRYENLFFEQLVHSSGWLAPNKSYNGEKGFSHFLMQFSWGELTGIKGSISGINEQNDTLLFWEITEFASLKANETTFMQLGKIGFALGKAHYPSEKERNGTFQLGYKDGSKEEHKDRHTFIDSNTIETVSEILDPESRQWRVESILIWKRVQ